MKSWQLDRRVDSLSQEIADSAKTETRIDVNCLSQPERELFETIDEIIQQYKPANPPKDVIEKNANLWYKGLEIFGRRATELFVDVMPTSICCNELEEWYFKLYFHNFLLDWMESVQKLRDMPKEKQNALLVERREMGLLDKVFRLHRNQPEPETQKQQRSSQNEACTIDQAN